MGSTQERNTFKLYSKNTIGIFTILFSTFFGALMLVRNLRGLNKKVASRWVLAFGILYTLASIMILELVGNSTNLSIILNLIGAGILTIVFWNRYIGKTIEFTARHWFKPALIIVGSLVFVCLVYVYWFPIFSSILG